ncbi:MAG: ATP-binding protein [Bacillota bacterium]
MEQTMSIVARKDSIKKAWLRDGAVQAPGYFSSFNRLAFYKINGLADFWTDSEGLKYNSLFTDVLSSISGPGTEFAYIIHSTGKGINLYVGVTEAYKDVFASLLTATYPYIDAAVHSDVSIRNMIRASGTHGGVITGMPTDKLKDNSWGTQIERMIKGLFGRQWLYVVTARSMDSQHGPTLLDAAFEEMRDLSPLLKVSADSRGVLQDERIEINDLIAQDYYDSLSALANKLQIGCALGLWSCNVLYFSPDKVTAVAMGRLIKSVFAGAESVPEPVRNIPLNKVSFITENGLGLINDRLASAEEYNFLTLQSISTEPFSFYTYRFQTILNSEDLSVYCQLPRLEAPGYYVDSYVRFDVADRRKGANFSIGKVVYDGNVLAQGDYVIDINALTRHCLIIGLTGGGKTNTAKHLLTTLWAKHNIPFIVIESAKREYWELARIQGMDRLFIFTLGNEDKNSVKYRINPFERIGDIPLQTHIDYLLAAFKASFDLFPPLPYVLETCVYEIYEDRGWDILSNTNKWGRSDYPMLQDLYHKVDIVVDRLGYDSRIRSDIIASLKTRIGSLMIGGKGAMLNTESSFPVDKLLRCPVVLELEDIGDDDVKAFIIGIFLVQLYEYRKTSPANVRELRHVLLIEEAHRLLQNVDTSQSSEAANPRGKAVEFFCNMLAEIRAFGQGMIISDQMPTKLAPDVLKNTNIKITHRIVTQEDREAIGKAMNMVQKQIDYISTFRIGYAAIYTEGDNRPNLVKLPLVVGNNNLSRQTVIREVNKKVKSTAGGLYSRRPTGLSCAFCTSKCKYASRTEVLISSAFIGLRFVHRTADYINSKGFCNGYTLKSIVERMEAKVGRPFSLDEKLCLLNPFLDLIEIPEAYKYQAVVHLVNLLEEGGEK